MKFVEFICLCVRLAEVLLPAVIIMWGLSLLLTETAQGLTMIGVGSILATLEARTCCRENKN